MEPTSTPHSAISDETIESDAEPRNGHTRRNFIRGVAAAGASTVGAAALDVAGITHLLDDSAQAATGAVGPFGEFDALAASSADAFEVPAGYRADLLISWGDAFANTDGDMFTWGFNNDFLAYFPLDGSKEGLLFANHEYPAPFFQHGNTNPAAKTPAEIAIEQESVGNSVIHIKRNADGIWELVTPSVYNRRITGATPDCEITGPIAGGTEPGGLIVGSTAPGSVANCSGGITPWGTALSCEENWADYGSTTGFGYGWGGEYVSTTYAKHGWVVETDPYDPSFTPRKHTALGRFRHENTAFRHVPGKKFVLYMGDDRANDGVYKFVSDLEYKPGQRANNLKILEAGTLYIAKWTPEGRRRFAAINGQLLTGNQGSGEWVVVNDDELAETSARLKVRFGTTEFNNRYATNRPEDVEVDSDGSVLIAFTNNTGSGVFDAHGSVRRLIETANNPEATTFTWMDYAEGGRTNRPSPGERGFSSCDNLAFDSAGNLWVVTDISSSALQGSTSPAAHYAYHLNNAIFMIPRSGPNAGIAFRFANMPVEAEGTGPYFTPDDSSLFIAVQHPGEETPNRPGATPADANTHTSWWPDGNKTDAQNPSMPRPSTVVVTKVAPDDPDAPVIPPPPGNGAVTPLAVRALSSKLDKLLRGGLPVEVKLGQPGTVELVLTGTLPGSIFGRSKTNAELARAELSFGAAGTQTAKLRASGLAKAALKRLPNGAKVKAQLSSTAVDAAGKVEHLGSPLKLK